MPPVSAPSDSLRLLSWNVNGLRACAKQGFGRFLARSGAFAVGVQEARARVELARPGGHSIGNPLQQCRVSNNLLYIIFHNVSSLDVFRKTVL